ncbi:MAG: YraN family protein [Acidimicrobiia bacterium]|nr:YraN family protein [Acidimicrobiia bacterium]
MTTARRALGSSGEDAAAAWYEANGYRILARNWRCRQGEIDLVLRRGRTIVFCEVKTRTSAAFGAPIEAVTRTKQLRLRALAARWLAESTTPAGEIRFDVVSVLAGELEVLEGAF